jgi:hypothetical protein
VAVGDGGDGLSRRNLITKKLLFFGGAERTVCDRSLPPPLFLAPLVGRAVAVFGHRILFQCVPSLNKIVALPVVTGYDATPVVEPSG